MKALKDWCAKRGNLTEAPLTVGYNYDSLQIDNRARNSLNKTLGTSFRLVYREHGKYSHQWKSGKITWNNECFLIVTEDYRVISFSNSEWANIDEVKK